MPIGEFSDAVVEGRGRNQASVPSQSAENGQVASAVDPIFLTAGVHLFTPKATVVLQRIIRRTVS